MYTYTSNNITRLQHIIFIVNTLQYFRKQSNNGQQHRKPPNVRTDKLIITDQQSKTELSHELYYSQNA